MKRLFLITILLMFACIPILNAANTVTTDTDGRFVMLSAIDSDWTSASEWALVSIQFNPGAANDILIMKATTDAGPQILYLESDDGLPRIKYFYDAVATPMLDYSASTISGGGTVIIHFNK